KQPDVVDAVLKHGDTLDPHAEGEACEFLGIDADKSEHNRIHHPAAADLEPPRSLANPTPAALADEASKIHFRRRLRKGEIAGPKAHLHRIAEEMLEKER